MMTDRLDKTVFRKQSFAESADNRKHWRSRPVEERLKTANYLIAVAYHFNARHFAGLQVREDRPTYSREDYLFHPDFRDFILALNQQQVEYLLVGGYAVIIHGYPRTTGDLDIWLNPTPDNYKKVVRAFLQFGMPLFDMTETNFLDTRQFDVFSFGMPPVSIDILTDVKGLDFEEALTNAESINIEAVEISLLSFEDLIKSKRAAGRFKDLNDIENLRPEE